MRKKNIKYIYIYIYREREREEEREGERETLRLRYPNLQIHAQIENSFFIYLANEIILFILILII